MKSISKKHLTIAGGLALCVVLVALIGAQFQKKEPVDATAASANTAASSATVDPNTNATENKEAVTVTPPTISSAASTASGAVSSGTKQTIQPDVTKPTAPTAKAKTDPTQNPSGEKVTKSSTTSSAKKKTTTSSASTSSSDESSGGLPGFDNVPEGGPNQRTYVDGPGDINKQVGIMD